METLKTVGIKELKNNLSAYLREVQHGARLLVTDRNVVVAEVRGPASPVTSGPVPSEAMADLVNRGILALPTAPKVAMEPSHLALPEGSGLVLLDAERGD